MKSLKIFTLFLLLPLLTKAQQNADFEQRMYDIYKQSYGQEISDEKWAGYILGIGNRSYQIREGDTLWDLSIVFFGDGLFWSKIWSYNSSLTNPHYLKVGQNIRFFTGSMETAPGILVEPEGQVLAAPRQQKENLPKDFPAGFKAVPEAITLTQKESKDEYPASNVEAQKEGKAKDLMAELKPIVNPQGLYPGAPSIPAPRVLVKPVLEWLPSTFANTDSYDASKYDEKGISLDLRPPVRVNPLFVASSFLYGRESHQYPNVGRLIEAENNERLLGLNHKVYFESDTPFEIGERLTVMGKKYSFDRNGFTGDVIEYQGSVEVTEKVKKKIYRATVIKSLSGIKGNPWLSREEIPTFNDDYAGRPNEKKFQVVGGGNDNVTRFYGQSDVIFIGGGTNRGVRVGDIFGIYKRRDIRYQGTNITRSPTPIGHIKIFRSEPTIASAFVISSSDVILPGDETGVPTIVEGQTTASELKDLNDIETGLDFLSDPEPAAEGSLEEELSEIE